MGTTEEMPALARAPSTKRKAAHENQENSSPRDDNVQLARALLESRPSKKKLKAEAAPAAAAPAAAEAPPKAAPSPPAQPAAAQVLGAGFRSSSVLCKQRKGCTGKSSAAECLQDEAGVPYMGAKPSEAGCDSKSGFWSLPDWCDRPLTLKENLMVDEDVQRCDPLPVWQLQPCCRPVASCVLM